jgi:uncharacterized repeat protein (TIGR03803 family)
MRIRHFPSILPMLSFFFVFLVLPASLFAASHKTLYSFAGGADGALPPGGMVFDANGNLFGLTNSGGNQECISSLSAGCGTVFELTLNGGIWKERVIHAFDPSIDGGNPYGAPAIDAAGNLYGATFYFGPFASGTLWQLTPDGENWKENVLHAFHGTSDGFSCYGLGFDPHGRLFGTTFGGGTNDDGLVFHLVPLRNGKWSEAVLHDFAGNDNDGSAPSDALTFDANGNAFGTTYEGGPHLTGTVFEMQHKKGGWTETPIYIFQGLPFGKSTDGTNPSAGVIFDKAGNLYGTTSYGGSKSVGTIYELSPDGNGGWSETILYAFTDGKDGGHPGGLIIDPAGNLYGVTSGHNTFGSVFELSPGQGGKWNFKALYDFKNGNDGSAPTGSLVRDSDGNLYGTAEFGGKNGLGVVFEITP